VDRYQIQPIFVVYPFMVIESRRRSLLKTLSYRVIVTVILAVVTFVFTGRLYQTSAISIVFALLATIAYYVHERVWTTIKWK
jgi:adenylylsulfate kinase